MPSKARLAVIFSGIFALALGGYLGAAHFSGGAFPTPGLDVGGDRGELRRLALSFWEDIQFKDFERAASYHADEVQEDVDIPYLLERLFLVKPENLDIQEFEVVMVDLDSTGLRARVKTRLRVDVLVKSKVREQEVMLYFHRDDPTAAWTMELERSLRPADYDKDKKH